MDKEQVQSCHDCQYASDICGHCEKECVYCHATSKIVYPIHSGFCVEFRPHHNYYNPYIEQMKQDAENFFGIVKRGSE